MSFTEITRPHPFVAVVTLNRPERMNAMAFDVMIPFRDALRDIGSDNDVRVVIVTGAGRGFCSGADHENPGTMPNIEGLTLPTIAMRSMEMLDDVVATVRRLHQPVIAAVNGAAIGGGFCLALAADIRIASEDAYFRAAGINNGLTAAELGISFLLPRTVGQSRAAEIMLTGRDVDAAEAERTGLVSRVVPGPELLPACFELADRINGWSRAGVELTKRQLWNSLDASSLQSHMDAEGTSQLFVRITTRNFEEAVAARKERRTPRFRGLNTGPGIGQGALTSELAAMSRYSRSSTASSSEMRDAARNSSNASNMWRSQASRSGGPITNGAWRIRSLGWPRSSP